MSLFDDIETPVEDIETDVFGHRIKPGGYEFQITDVTFKEFAEDHATMGGQKAIIFELTVTDGDHEDEIGHTFDSFCRLPNSAVQGDEKAKMFASILKQNMLQFGIPESRLGRWDPENPDDVEAIIGLVGTGKIAINKKKKDFDNLYNFTLTEESGVSDTVITPESSSLAEGWKS